MLKLFVGNKNYSSWSMRPWVLLTQAGIPFEEVMVRFDAFTPESAFKQTLAGVAPTGKVPVLKDGDLTVWDTLAMRNTWPSSFPINTCGRQTGLHAHKPRSICAEMHGGFGSLRSLCPMNIEALLPDTGALLLRDQPGLRADLDRIVGMWSGLLATHGGPLLFGDFSVADAYFAPVVMRLHTYALPVPAPVAAYMERVTALPGVQGWIQQALAEKDFLDFEEPYRLKP